MGIDVFMYIYAHLCICMYVNIYVSVWISMYVHLYNNYDSTKDERVEINWFKVSIIYVKEIDINSI